MTPTAAVLVGAAQLSQKDVELVDALEPLAMFDQLAREAVEDAGLSARALERVDTIGIVDTPAWKPQNGPRLLAERLCATPAKEIVTTVGGEMPVTLVNRVAGLISEGRSQLALITGSSNLKTLRAARRRKVALNWTLGGSGQPELLGVARPGHSQHEAAHGLKAPNVIYPVFENALRAHRGLGLDTHRQQMGALLSRFTEVAAKNPHAWFPTPRSADEITTATAQNRMIAFPYTKYMNAMAETDQAAALLMMSAEAARRFGIPEERWAYWWGGASGEETAWFPMERAGFASSPSLRQTASRALAEAGTPIDALRYIDFYSCFPVAVEMACEMLGIDEADRRGLTLTGGLPYAGGPANNYTLHALATLMRRLRSDPGAIGLVTGNGWYLSKHSACVCASAPRDPLVHPVLELATEEASPPVEVAEEATGHGTVEAYTVLYDRDGTPTQGIVLGRLGDGRRFVANTPEDRDLLEAFVCAEQVGREGDLAHVGGLNRFDPR
jgi:acetyl-CoA C-acetyltransferase